MTPTSVPHTTQAGGSRTQFALVWAALAAAAVAKLYLAATTAGTLDVAAYADYALKIRALGGVGLYHDPGAYNNPFVYLPLTIHALRLVDWLAAATPLPFAFWLRLPCVLADAGSVLVVWKYFALANDGANDSANDGAAEQSAHAPRSFNFAPGSFAPAPWQFGSLLVLALSPVSLVVSGYHGNTDSTMIFLALLSIFLVEGRRRVFAAGIVFGLALGLKVVPLVFVPALWFYLGGPRPRLRFFGAAAAAVVVTSLPYVLIEPLTIARAVFGYGSLYGSWGWSYLLAQALPETLRYERYPHGITGAHAAYAGAGKWLVFGLILAASVWMNRRGGRRPPSLVAQCGLVMSIFLALAPGFGTQYLVWLVPFVAALALFSSLVYNTVAGYFVLVSYACWFYQPLPAYCATYAYPPLMLASWFSVIIVAFFYVHSVRRRASARFAEPGVGA